MFITKPGQTQKQLEVARAKYVSRREAAEQKRQALVPTLKLPKAVAARVIAIREALPEPGASDAALAVLDARIAKLRASRVDLLQRQHEYTRTPKAQAVYTQTREAVGKLDRELNGYLTIRELLDKHDKSPSLIRGMLNGAAGIFPELKG